MKLSFNRADEIYRQRILPILRKHDAEYDFAIDELKKEFGEENTSMIINQNWFFNRCENCDNVKVTRGDKTICKKCDIE